MKEQNDGTAADRTAMEDAGYRTDAGLGVPPVDTGGGGGGELHDARLCPRCGAAMLWMATSTEFGRWICPACGYRGPQTGPGTDTPVDTGGGAEGDPTRLMTTDALLAAGALRLPPPASLAGTRIATLGAVAAHVDAAAGWSVDASIKEPSRMLRAADFANSRGLRLYSA